MTRCVRANWTPPYGHGVWTPSLHNIIKAETVVGWGVPIGIAVDLVVIACSHNHSLLLNVEEA